MGRNGAVVTSVHALLGQIRKTYGYEAASKNIKNYKVTATYSPGTSTHSAIFVLWIDFVSLNKWQNVAGNIWEILDVLVFGIAFLQSRFFNSLCLRRSFQVLQKYIHFVLGKVTLRHYHSPFHSLIFPSDRLRQRQNKWIHHSDKANGLMSPKHDSLLLLLLLLIAGSLCHGFPPVQLPMFFHFVAVLESHLDSSRPHFPFVCLSQMFPTVLIPLWLQKRTLCDQNDPKQRNSIKSFKMIIFPDFRGNAHLVLCQKMCWVGYRRVVMGRAGQEGWAQEAGGGEGVNI